MKRLLLLFIVVLIGLVDVLPAIAQQATGDRIQVAQQEKRRTLFDLLFGEEPAPAPPPVQQTRPRQQATPVKPATPAKPKVEKAADAARLAVFGDSLAIDLTKALERFYADDPNLIVTGYGDSASGMVRTDYLDWNDKLAKEIASNSFDIAVVMIGVNDRQDMQIDGKSYAVLTPEWTQAYDARLNRFLGQLRAARKPVIWMGLPPMSGNEFSTAMSQISALQKLAAFSAGADYLDIYDRFVGEDGRYSAYGPDVSGQNALMRKDDGIHFSNAGSDKLAFYISQSIRNVYRGGTISVAVSDPLLGTDAAAMLRPPYQGVGQTRLLEVAGAVLPLSRAPARANDLVTGVANAGGSDVGFSLEQLMRAPTGRADAFGVGIDPGQERLEEQRESGAIQ